MKTHTKFNPETADAVVLLRDGGWSWNRIARFLNIGGTTAKAWYLCRTENVVPFPARSEAAA